MIDTALILPTLQIYVGGHIRTNSFVDNQQIPRMYIVIEAEEVCCLREGEECIRRRRFVV